ncbi:MAG: hypothetical protein KC731_22250 [Myxococcales bacterium]|nr:hypothetical protein [Myxococcales bacterium]
MHAHPFSTLPSLFELHDADDEHSGIRPIPEDDALLIVADQHDDLDAPACVYAVATSHRHRAFRRYYLGTRFAVGVIPSADWETRMRADAVGPGAIAQARRWLDRHVI